MATVHRGTTEGASRGGPHGLPSWLSDEAAPTVQEARARSWVRSGRSQEKEMATHSSIPAWRIPWTEEPGGLQSMGSRKSRTGLSD